MRPLAMSRATALLVAACGGTAAPSPSPSPSPTPKPTVVAKVATDATLGKILVDQAGKTVYQWFKDTDENSQCYDACAAVWPPFLVEVKSVAGDGVVNGKIGTVARKDGKLQATYNTMQLYYFLHHSADKPTAGQGSTACGAPRVHLHATKGWRH